MISAGSGLEKFVVPVPTQQEQARSVTMSRTVAGLSQCLPQQEQARSLAMRLRAIVLFQHLPQQEQGRSENGHWPTVKVF